MIKKNGTTLSVRRNQPKRREKEGDEHRTFNEAKTELEAVSETVNPG
jgi:hypothetical protein